MFHKLLLATNLLEEQSIRKLLSNTYRNAQYGDSKTRFGW